MKWPRLGLAARLTLLIVGVLVAAQLGNAVLITNVERSLRQQRAEAVIVERTAQAARLAEFAPMLQRRQLRRPGFIIDDRPPSGDQRLPQAEEMLIKALEEVDIVGREVLAFRITVRERPGLVAAVQLSNGQWLAHRQPVPASAVIPWRILVVQTTILTLVLLLPAVYVSRRVARPLQQLTIAADGFLTDKDAPPLPEDGPPDVQALSQAFAALQDRILTALEERSMMLGSIGHDLRTPLASLRIRVESVGDEKLREQMIASIESLGQSLDEILSFSKTGATELRETVRTDALVRSFAKEYAGKPVLLGDVAAATIEVSPQSILRALRNLVNNALRYAGHAEVTAHLEPGQFVFVVRDRGPGLEPDNLEKLQKPFVRGEASRSRSSGGAGLGLAIVRAVAEAHGGSLFLANRPGGGLEASLRVPRGAATA
ncbi:MAG: ATP-binding protein [Pseudomonadota bacterium]